MTSDNDESIRVSHENIWDIFSNEYWNNIYSNYLNILNT